METTAAETIRGKWRPMPGLLLLLEISTGDLSRWMD
jgi:hypothetical protein